MEALYRFSFDLMLIYVLQYSQQYTRVFHEVSSFKKGCFIIAYLDGILLFLNIIFHNRMMAYVEDCIYGGKWDEYKGKENVD